MEVTVKSINQISEKLDRETRAFLDRIAAYPLRKIDYVWALRQVLEQVEIELQAAKETL